MHYGSKTVTVSLSSSDKGAVTVSLPTLKKGKYSVWVDYNGNSKFAADTSPKTTLTIN